MTMKKNIEGGWFKHWRSWHGDEVFKDKKKCDEAAWADLVGLANYEDGKVRRWKRFVTVKRGMIGWSQEALAQRLGWSVPAVKRFIKRLIEHKWIE